MNTNKDPSILQDNNIWI